MPAMTRLVVVGDEAWTLDVLRKHRRIEKADLVIRWEPGQNSALDTRSIAKGRDVGNVVVQRTAGDVPRDVAYDVTFAFVFNAFYPGKVIHTD